MASLVFEQDDKEEELLAQALYVDEDRLDVDDTDVVILHGDSERLLIAVQSHAEDLLAFCRRRLPPGFEVIVVLARRGLVLIRAECDVQIKPVGDASER